MTTDERVLKVLNMVKAPPTRIVRSEDGDVCIEWQHKHPFYFEVEISGESVSAMARHKGRYRHWDLHLEDKC